MPMICELLSTPSRMKLFCTAHCPWALNPDSRWTWPNAGSTPGASIASCAKLRPFTGSWPICAAPMVCVSEDVSVLSRSGAGPHRNRIGERRRARAGRRARARASAWTSIGVADRSLECRHFDGDLVTADDQRREQVVAVGVGRGLGWSRRCRTWP